MNKFRLQSRIPQLSSKYQKEARKIIVETLALIESDIKTEMAAPKTGRIYPRGSNPPHQASAPGEAPAMDEGNLAEIQTEMISDTEGVIWPPAEYAVHLEFGTAHMEPRPFFGPAFERAEPEFEEKLKRLANL